MAGTDTTFSSSNVLTQHAAENDYQNEGKSAKEKKPLAPLSILERVINYF
jgi:hypothetical protein